VEIKTIVKNQKYFASISVIDTGIGIKNENLKQIFEEFRQVSEGLSRQFEGTGLGLTITKKFIELLAGEIIVTSEYGKGSTFEVLFPLHNFKLSHPEPDLTGKSNLATDDELVLKELPDVLMVDNDEASREITRLFLKNICNIDFAESGEDAIKLVKKKSYKLILMDINLGKGLSGTETAQRIKKLSKYKNTPIVALTAFALAGEKEEFIKLGCTHYLSKPFLKKDLIDLFKSILY
jgi:CheY-like chemotaxis protein